MRTSQMTWYKIYGWKENPFSGKINTELIGVEKEKERLKDHVLAGDICFLTGDRGLGKTSILEWLRLNLKRHTLMYVDAEKSDKFDLDDLLKKNTSFWRKYPKNPVLLIDESQNLKEDLVAILKSYWQEGIIKSIVISQTDKKLKNLSDNFKDRIGSRIIELNNLSKSDSIILIKNRCGEKCPFDDLAIDSIITLSNGNPRRVLENCEMVCIEVKKKNISKYDVEKILKKEKEEQKFSPMQEKIIGLLKERDRTIKEIVEITKSTEGSIGKQVSNLMMQNLVRIVNQDRPKIYGLVKKEQ